ncbi:hypothetical protein [Rhizocola hellebori]|uniref:hypothetical protein n=1 Tax=Rhizocola hellebori TaxID=1392758 RepID=UPI001945740B|nr:hypothetical protein [Rhizocola hellebori]
MRSLFPSPPAPGRVALKHTGWLLLAVVAAAALSLARSPRPGALNTIWIEDAHNFLNDALTDGFKNNLFKSLNGYYHFGPRLIAELVSLAPVRWSAALISIAAAGVTAGFGAIAYVASKPFLQRWWLQLVVAAPLVLLPLARVQADNDIATLQFPGLYVLFWIALWRPASRPAQAVAVLATAFVTFSSIIPIILLPLFALRFYVVRDWATRLICLAYSAGLGLHFLGLALGKATRSEVCCRRYDLFWVAQEYATKTVPRTIFGERWLGGPGMDVTGPVAAQGSPAVHTGLMVLAWLVVLAALILALVKFTNPHWPLAIAATVAGAALFAGTVTNIGSVQPRYLIAPALLVLTVLAALLRPHDSQPPASRPQTRQLSASRLGLGRSAVPALVLIAVMVVVAAVNFRADNRRSETWPWSDLVSQATLACQSQPIDSHVVWGGYWWRVTIPCDRVR